MVTGYWIRDGRIYGPKSDGSYWIEKDKIFGPRDAGRYKIEGRHICGPATTLPWFSKRQKKDDRKKTFF